MKTIQAQKQLYQIQDNELAVLMFLSTTGEAWEVLNQLEVADMQQEGLLRLLEEAYGSKADEDLRRDSLPQLPPLSWPKHSCLSSNAQAFAHRVLARRYRHGHIRPRICAADVDQLH